jgi:molecular chaperone HscB
MRLIKQLSTNYRGGTSPQIATSVHRAFVHKANGDNEACIFCRLRVGNFSIKPHQQRPLVTRRLASTAASSRFSTVQGNQQERQNDHPPSEVIKNPPDITSYYTIFPETIPGGPPPGAPFQIPLLPLRREFLKLQGLTHPDKFPPGPAKHRAEVLSAHINEAYRTLADPLRRAQYLLAEWHGIDVITEDGAAKYEPDPETLMTVMEVQEAIAEATGGEEAEATVTRLKAENTSLVEESVKVLAEAFDRGDIKTAREECMRLRFWYTVGESLKEWEPGRSELRVIH